MMVYGMVCYEEIKAIAARYRQKKIRSEAYSGLARVCVIAHVWNFRQTVVLCFDPCGIRSNHATVFGNDIAGKGILMRFKLLERDMDRLASRPYIVRKWHEASKVWADDPVFFLITYFFFIPACIIAMAICVIGFVCSLFGIYP